MLAETAAAPPSRALLADLLEQPEKDLPSFVSGCIKEWQQKPVPPVVVDDGPAKVYAVE